MEPSKPQLSRTSTSISSSPSPLEFLKNKKIALKTRHGNYLSYSGQKVEIKDEIDESEMFTPILHYDDSISFQTYDGTFLRAWPKILLQSNEVGSIIFICYVKIWIYFYYFLYNNFSSAFTYTCIYKKYINKFISLDTNNKLEGWEKWRLVSLNEQKYAIQSCHKNYISVQPTKSGSKITLEKTVEAWERFEIILVRSNEILHDVEFIFSNAKNFYTKLKPISENTFNNLNHVEQITHLNFETELKTWSKWIQNGGETLINITKITFRKPILQNSIDLAYSEEIRTVEVDLRRNVEIFENIKIDFSQVVNVPPLKQKKLAVSYEEILMEIPWIGIVSAEREKIQISGIWRGVLVGSIKEQMEEG